jgi:hypothetical protein
MSRENLKIIGSAQGVAKDEQGYVPKEHRVYNQKSERQYLR